MNSVTEINLQATSRRQNVKRLSRSVTSDEHGRAKVSLFYKFDRVADKSTYQVLIRDTACHSNSYKNCAATYLQDFQK